MKKTSIESWINTLGFNIVKECEWWEKAVVNNSVTLRKRFRDMSDDDRTGVFNPATGNWVTVDVPNIYSYNIVKKTIRANESAMINARVKIDIEARFPKDVKAKYASDVANAIVEQKERLQWTADLEQYIAQEMQLGAGVFVHTGWNPEIKRKSNIPRWEKEEIMEGGEASCPSCGALIQVTEEVDAEMPVVPCPECGDMAPVTQMPMAAEMDVVGGTEEFLTGDTETTTHPFWNFRVDGNKTHGGNLQKARWFEHHFLQSVDELEVEYPEHEAMIRGSSGELSYPLRWQLALQRGMTYPVDQNDRYVDEWREVRKIYVTPAMYANFQADTNFELKGKDGARFSIKIGQGLKDALYKGEKQPEDTVWCIKVIKQGILDIYPRDFRREWAYTSFMSNPSSFWGLFYTELISLQDIVNYMLTLQVYHIRRNAITSIVYNSRAFNPEDFEEDLIPTREEFPYDINIGNMFGIVPPLTLSGEPMEMMNTMIMGVSDVSQVTPAMQGQAQPNEPYHAQLLQKQQSLGLLSPSQLSKAHAKKQWAMAQLYFTKENWTEEDTDYYIRLNPDWTTDTIQAFLECDIDSDLIVDFIEGSEIPRSLIEREIEMRQFMQDVLAIAQVNPMILKPEMLNDILQRLAQAGGIDIDINDMEADLNLAQVRYDKIIELIKDVPVPADQAPEIAMQLMNQPAVKMVLYPTLREGHEIQLEFFSDKLRMELAKDDINYLLAGCLQIECEWCDQMMVMAATRQMQMQMAAQAPMMQMQQEQMQQEQESVAAEKEAEMADKEQDRESRREERQEDIAIRREEREAGELSEARKMQYDLANKVIDMKNSKGAAK